MSLPNYIVNLEELFESILKAYYNHILYEGGKKRIESQLKKIPPKDTGKFLFNFNREIFLENVLINLTDKRNIGYNNNWSLKIDKEIYFDSVYLKESDEKKSFFSPMPVKKDSEILIEFYNNHDEEVNIGYDLEFFQKDIMGNVIIVCIDADTQKIIKHFATPVIPETNSKIKAPSITGFNPVEEYKDIMLQLQSLTQVVYFSYVGV